MGPVLSNIEGLVRMPYGCGEQNMLNFVPNIVVLRYLKATSRAEPSLEAKAVKFMEAGYQRELTYRYVTLTRASKASLDWYVPGAPTTPSRRSARATSLVPPG